MSETNLLLADIKRAIVADPSLAPKILEVVSHGLQCFQAHEKTKRESLALDAINALLATGTFPELTIPWMIDVAIHQFPNGFGCHSAAEREFWQRFIAEANRQEVDWEWLKTKGDEFVTWWQTYVMD